MPCISGSNETKMSSKSPVIKFSPFEALFIGEKNKVLKRQPTKNAIFITRKIHRRKKFNLRDLFDLEQSTSKSNNDYIFKMPQRVAEYLENKKSNFKECKKIENKDILYLDINGKKMVVRNNGLLKSKAKNAKLKSNKIKFKRKLELMNSSKNNINTSNLNNRIVKKFPSQTSRLRFNQIKNKKFSLRLVLKDLDRSKNSKNNGNRHLLRGKDGKFISKKEYFKIKSGEINSKNNFLSNSSKTSFEKQKGREFHSEVEDKDSTNGFTSACSTSNQVETIASQVLTNKSPNEYLQCDHPFTDLIFPKCPKADAIIDLDEDENLMDLVYENFPVIKFKSKESFSSDFSDSLRDRFVLPERNIKIYEKKKNGFLNSDKLTVIFNNHIPHIKPKGLANVKSISYHCKQGIPSVIDEPSTNNNHLIVSSQSFDCFFLQDYVGKEIFIENFIKPFWQNSWFGRLPKN